MSGLVSVGYANCQKIPLASIVIEDCSCHRERVKATGKSANWGDKFIDSCGLRSIDVGERRNRKGYEQKDHQSFGNIQREASILGFGGRDRFQKKTLAVNYTLG